MSKQTDFFEHVERNFGFLTDDLGFQLTGRQQVGDNLSTEYRSSLVYTRVLKTAPDFEPRFVFGRIGVDDVPGGTGFDWTDVAGLDCCRDWTWQHSEGDAIAGRVEQLARLLKECGGEALRGDKNVYVEMLNRKNQLREQHVDEERNSLIRARARTAWEEKDYEKVKELYSEIEEQLSDSEKKKMSFAEKRCTDQ